MNFVHHWAQQVLLHWQEVVKQEQGVQQLQEGLVALVAVVAIAGAEYEGKNIEERLDSDKERLEKAKKENNNVTENELDGETNARIGCGEGYTGSTPEARDWVIKSAESDDCYIPRTYEKMNDHIKLPDEGFQAFLEKGYKEIRLRGFDDISEVSKNTGISESVETDDGMQFTMTVCTPQFYNSYMEKEGVDFVCASPPDIIVKELNKDIIRKALEDFCVDDGYWSKAFFLLGVSEGVFSIESMNDMMKKYMAELEIYDK